MIITCYIHELEFIQIFTVCTAKGVGGGGEREQASMPDPFQEK